VPWCAAAVTLGRAPSCCLQPDEALWAAARRPVRRTAGGTVVRLLTRTLAIALAFLLSALAFAESEGLTGAATITPSELGARRDSGTAPVVIDVRTAKEYAGGHIPGAVNIPFDQIADRISEVEAPNGVALYCMVGPRARKGEAALLTSGYTAVLHIEGGLAAWEAAGNPVERDR